MAKTHANLMIYSILEQPLNELNFPFVYNLFVQNELIFPVVYNLFVQNDIQNKTQHRFMNMKNEGRDKTETGIKT